MEAVYNAYEKLKENGLPFWFVNFSALDKYFHIGKTSTFHIVTTASLINLAKNFDNIQYPGLSYIDAFIERQGRYFLFHCIDSIEDILSLPQYSFSVQSLIYSLQDDIFLDPAGIYNDLRKPSLLCLTGRLSTWPAVMDAARLISRYHYHIALETPDPNLTSFKEELPLLLQRELLLSVLGGRYPEKGLDLLKHSGFIARFWPELAAMEAVIHSKEYHPEGNLWKHTLESLKYRKSRDIALSIALLLHDIGKGVAGRTKDKPFKDHAKLGAGIAGSFLSRLGFAKEFIDEVQFLVRYHMLPAAINKMPLFRIKNILDSRYFPKLLEVYRADILSTYRGPHKYFEACRIYKTYLKDKANPYKQMKKGKVILSK
jgi:poly(A) polymerase